MKKTIYSLFFLSFININLQAQTIDGDSLQSILDNEPQEQHELNVETMLDANSSIHTQDIPINGNLQLLTSLQHRNPSLSIYNNSGSPGASMSAILRGRNSLFSSASPLFVLDGMPIDNSEWNNNTGGSDQSNRLIDINPSDIASVEIISGSVGTVLYGVRGANGVVLLTSKKGISSVPRINITSEITSSKVGKLPLRQSTYAQGRPQNGILTYRGPETYYSSSWGPEISSLEFDGNTNYLFDQNGRLVVNGQGNGNPAIAYDPYVFFNDAISSNLNASLSGKTSLFNYYISAGRNTVNGVIPKSNYTRNSIAGSISTDITPKIEINASARYVLGNANRTLKGSNIRGVMLGLLRNTPTFDITNGLSPSEAVDNSSSYILPDGSQRSYRAGVYDSPYWTINKNPNHQKNNRFIGNASINYKLNKDINFIAMGGIDSYSDTREGGIDINPGWYEGSAYLRELDYQSSNIDLRTNINKSINDKLDIKFQLGVNYFDTRTKEETTEGLILKSTDNVNISNTEEIEYTPYTISTKNIGFLSSLDLTYNNILNLLLSARQDYSSTSGSNQQGFLSFGMRTSFDIIRLINFEEENQSSTQLKIFAGYGRSGLSAPASLSLSSFVPTVISGDGFIQPGELSNTLERTDIGGNSELSPEKTDAFEIGISVTELWNRVGLNVTYYNEKTSDVILLREIAPSGGYTTIYDNVGTIRNRGFEILLMVNPIKTNNFSWIFNANFNNNKNTVEKIDLLNTKNVFLTGFTSASSTFQEGQPYGAISGSSFFKNAKGETIIDNNGYPIVGPNNQIIGDPNPNYILGLENQFKIGKNLNISVLIDIKQGGDVYCGTCGVMDYFGVSQLSADERNETFVFEGVRLDGTENTQVVKLADLDNGTFDYYRTRYGFSGVSSLNVFDASWIRLRRINLTYDFSSIVSKTPFIHAFTLGVYADNLWLSTDYPGIDPETNLTGNSNGFGFDYFNNPSAKTIGISLNLTL